MAFEASQRDGRWMIVAGPIEFGPYADEAKAVAAATALNASNAERSLMTSTRPSTLSLVRSGKTPRR